jgi:hypothetical protein
MTNELIGLVKSIDSRLEEIEKSKQNISTQTSKMLDCLAKIRGMLGPHTADMGADEVRTLALAKIAEHLLKGHATKVYGRFDDSLCGGGWQDFSTNDANSKKYQALLINIEPKVPNATS